MGELLVELFILLFAAELVYALWCAWDMRRAYGRRLMDSILWDRLIRSQVRTVVAGLLIGPVTLWRLVMFVYPDAGIDPIPAPWGALAITAGLMLLFWGPISDRQTLRRIQRDRTR